MRALLSSLNQSRSRQQRDGERGRIGGEAGLSILPQVVLRHDQALIKLAHGMTLVIYFYSIMQLLSMYVLVQNSFEYFKSIGPYRLELQYRCKRGAQTQITCVYLLFSRIVWQAAQVTAMLVHCSPPPVSRTGRVYQPMDKHPLWCNLITRFVLDIDIPL